MGPVGKRWPTARLNVSAGLETKRFQSLLTLIITIKILFKYLNHFSQSYQHCAQEVTSLLYNRLVCCGSTVTFSFGPSAINILCVNVGRFLSTSVKEEQTSLNGHGAWKRCVSSCSVSSPFKALRFILTCSPTLIMSLFSFMSFRNKTSGYSKTAF